MNEMDQDDRAYLRGRLLAGAKSKSEYKLSTAKSKPARPVGDGNGLASAGSNLLTNQPQTPTLTPKTKPPAAANTTPRREAASRATRPVSNTPTGSGKSHRRAKPADTLSLARRFIHRATARPRRRTVAATGLALAVISVGGLMYLSSRDSGGSANQAAGAATGITSQTDAPAKGTPDYATVLPAGKTVEQLGGWTRVSPADRDPVYAFSDKIGNTPVIVSQQPLPEDLRGSTDEEIAKLAKNFNANEKVSAGDMTLFVGKSAKGPQSIITYKGDLLILIKASAAVGNDQLVSYANSLR